MATSNTGIKVYEAIYSQLRTQIFSGKYRPGDMLPSESQLCTEFGASRETVRKGLKQLVQEGLAYSRAKTGYFVCTPNHSDLALTIQECWEDCSTHYSDIHGILPNVALQEKLEILPNQKVIEMTQITRRFDGEAVACEIKYVPYERAYPSVESEMRYAVLPDITLSKVDTFDFYTDIAVSAEGAPERIALAMDCAVGEPMLKIERIFIRQDGKRIGYSVQYRHGQSGILRGTSGHHM